MQEDVYAETLATCRGHGMFSGVEGIGALLSQFDLTFQQVAPLMKLRRKATPAAAKREHGYERQLFNETVAQLVAKRAALKYKPAAHQAQPLVPASEQHTACSSGGPGVHGDYRLSSGM